MENYGVILKRLRNMNGDSLKAAAKKIERSVGWLSEVENGHGLSRLGQAEFERIVTVMGGDQHRKMFKNWVSVERKKERKDHSLDGAVLKYIREKVGLSLIEASEKVGLSKRYLSNLENGHRPINDELRNRVIVAFGYSPSSFRNLTEKEARSKAVPARYKINILLNHMDDAGLGSVLDFILSQSAQPTANETRGEL